MTPVLVKPTAPAVLQARILVPAGGPAPMVMRAGEPVPAQTSLDTGDRYADEIVRPSGPRIEDERDMDEDRDADRARDAQEEADEEAAREAAEDFLTEFTGTPTAIVAGEAMPRETLEDSGDMMVEDILERDEDDADRDEQPDGDVSGLGAAVVSSVTGDVAVAPAAPTYVGAYAEPAADDKILGLTPMQWAGVALAGAVGYYAWKR